MQVVWMDLSIHGHVVLTAPRSELPIGSGQHVSMSPLVHSFAAHHVPMFETFPLPCLCCSMTRERRSNPARAARPRPPSLGDGEEDRARGSRVRRGPEPGQSSQRQLAARDENEGPIFCPNRSFIPRPPPLPASHRNLVRNAVPVDPIEIEGRSMDPTILRHSPKRIEVATARMRTPVDPDGIIPRLAIDYMKQKRDVRRMRQENPFQWCKFQGVEERFWSQFHHDYYLSVCMPKSVIQHKAPVRESIERHDHPDLNPMLAKLDEWRILPLMTFKHHWNTEILMQFWVTLYIDEENKVLHWLTEGLHYRCSYIQFSRLLGFDRSDREAPSIYDYYASGVGHADYVEAGLYVKPELANGKSHGLKPHFYVLNNLIRATIDPKVGDSTNVQGHAPRILVCFGLNKRFSVSDLLWRNIIDVASDPGKNFPYAPYLMYLITQVTSFRWHNDGVHKDWNIRNLGPHMGKLKGVAIEADEAGGSGDPVAGDGGDDDFVEEQPIPPVAPSVDPSSGSGRGRGRGCRRGNGSATRHALQKFMSYFCYCQKKTDERLRRIEEHHGLPPASPLRTFQDPFEEYDRTHGYTAEYEQQSQQQQFGQQDGYEQQGYEQQGCAQQQQQPSAFDPTDGGLPQGYSVEDTELGATYQEIFGSADQVTRTSTSSGVPPQFQPSSSRLCDYDDDGDDDDY